MRKPPNKLWALGPVISVLLIAAAYYLKVPAFRDAVNTRIPWAKEHLSRFVPPPEIVIIRDSPKSVAPAEPVEPPSPPAVAAVAHPAPAPAPIPEVRDEPLTMKGFAANPSLWPKTVKLRCATEFPAVLNGKKIGKVQAPAGTETRLVTVNGQMLGLEFQGGGAWVQASQTDLLEKVKIASR